MQFFVVFEIEGLPGLLYPALFAGCLTLCLANLIFIIIRCPRKGVGFRGLGRVCSDTGQGCFTLDLGPITFKD